jgi:phosphoserine phosphatase
LPEQREIEELTRKLEALKGQRSKIDAEASEWVEKRDKLNKRFKSLRAEAIELKNARDKLNENVKDLKQQRDEARIASRAKIEGIMKLRQEIKSFAKKRPQRSLRALQAEFDNIEWQIQTSSSSLEEEKHLVEQVKQIEAQLNIYRRLDQLKQRVAELEAELKALETRNKASHAKLTEMAQKSRQMHEKMLEKINESKKLKAEADNFHKLFLQTRERARALQEEIAGVLKHVWQLKEEVREEEEKGKKEDEEALREKLEKQAREKLRRGEKLTWEEFQLLAERGMGA